jgi:predicted kinase
MALTETSLATWLDQTIPPASHANGTIILLCGIAGAGKTTAARHLESKGFLRLSIDEEIWSTNGRYGIDYPAAAYPDLQKQAANAIWTRLEQLLREKTPVVVDNSFWSRATRDRYKQLIESHQRPWMLIYLKVPREILRARLLARQSRFDANAAFPIGDELLNKYLESFQPPSGEGELTFPNQ